MFGRKQSSFTLESRLAAHDLDRAPTEVSPDVGPTEVSPPPERRATPRPDPSAYFPPEQDQTATGDEGALLKLGGAQSVGAAAPDPALDSAPDPATSAAPKRRSGRAKTRLLGIDHAQSDAQVEDVLAGQVRQQASAPLTYHAVGWLVVMGGPGRGHSMPLRNGVSQLGRGDDQSVQLNFGDTSISRTNHASIAFDEEKRCFFIGHGGKANLVRLNGAPVLSTERLAHGDEIRIGETVLTLVAFCGEAFTWADHVEAEVELSGEDLSGTVGTPEATAEGDADKGATDTGPEGRA